MKIYHKYRVPTFLTLKYIFNPSLDFLYYKVPNITIIIAALVILFNPLSVFAAGGCPDTAICGGESLDDFVTIMESGQSVSDGAVLRVGTTLRLDARATAYGECDTTIPMPFPFLGCDPGPIYQRDVAKIMFAVDALTDGGLNGLYLVANYICDGVNHELDTMSGMCGGPITFTLNKPGSYKFIFYNIIDNPVCLLGVCLDSIVKSITVDAGGEKFNTDCNTIIDKGVSVSNGTVVRNDTDFTLPGIMPVAFTRYYNSRTAQSGVISSFGWTGGHTFDTKVDSIQSGLYRVTKPDSSVIYYSGTSSGGIYEAIIPKGEMTYLVKSSAGTFTRYFKDGSIEEFNSSGYMTATTDRNGNSISLVRDSANKLTTIIDTFGRVITLTYDTSNRVTQLVMPDGGAINYLYSGNALYKVTYPDGTNKTYEYTGYSLTGIKNENGNYIAKYTYDSPYSPDCKAITSSADGTNEKNSIAYVDDSHSTITDSLGNVTTYTIDKFGGRAHLTSISGPGCKECGQGAVAYTYDDNLNIISSTDANGNVTIFTYDAKGNMLTKTEANGTPLQRTTTYTYEPQFNQVTSMTDPNGYVTTFVYDTQGNLITTTDADGNNTSFTRDTKGLITQITDTQMNTTGFTYDQYGNIATITDSLENVTSYTYDIMGRQLTTTDANGNTTAYTYDPRGRLTQIKDSLNQLTGYSYDPAGNLTALTDAKGDQTQYFYDSINRLTRKINALSNQESFTYDTQSNLKTVTDANGKITSYTYDNYGRVYQAVSPDTGTTTYLYDPVGNMISKTDAQGVSISYVYDALNRLTTIHFPSDGDIVYTYDDCVNGVSRVCSMTDASGTTSYEYSKKGRVTKETKVIDNITYNTQYSYENDNLRTMTYPSGRVITYNISNNKVISVLNNTANLAADIAYEPFGGMSSITYGNGILGSISYDNGYRVSRIKAETVMDLTYAEDANGNVTSITNTLDPTKNKSFTYDALDRLSSTTAYGLWGSLVWTYDGVGNRLTENSNSYTYFPNTNKLSSANGKSFGYDTNGNTTSEASRIYTYNQNQRLMQVVGGAITANYNYYGKGQRAKKVVNGVTTLFHYNLGGQIIAESNSAGTFSAEYVYLNGQPLSRIEGTNTYYYHNDHLGTPQKMTDASGTVVWSADYKPFGEATITVSTITNNLRFPGQYFDAETGLSYNYFRDYNPVIGRYIESDPIGILEGANHLYAYVGNNPLKWFDPEGLEPSNGGPYHPPSGVSVSCRPSDSCSTLQGKIQQILRMIESHTGWDRNNPRPRGGNRHSPEIDDLWRAYANCQSIYINKCQQCGGNSSQNNPNTGLRNLLLMIMTIIPLVLAF